VSRDGGKNWVSFYAKLLNAFKGVFVFEVVFLRFDEGMVYVTIDDYWQNNFEMYVYASNDFG